MKTAEKRPQFLLIAGPNGAGKSTIYPTLSMIDPTEWVLEPIKIPPSHYINTDSVAQQGSLNDAEAGRKSLEIFQKHLGLRASFSFESTLGGRTILKRYRDLKLSGYRTICVFVWLRSAELSMARVMHRATIGKHYIPIQNVLSRHYRSAYHFVNDITPHSDIWVMLDNSALTPEIVAWGGREFGTANGEFLSSNRVLLQAFMSFYATGIDPCFNNLYSPSPEKIQRLSWSEGDEFTTTILRAIQAGVATRLAQRPMGTSITFLDEQNVLRFQLQAAGRTKKSRISVS
jgi:predicted ABC-type ATPase